MSTNKLFTRILSHHPPARKLFVHENSDSLLLFGYVDNNIYISKFKCSQNAVIEPVHEFNGDALKTDNAVHTIFFHNKTYYGIDVVGTLFSLSLVPADVADGDCDLFDDTLEKVDKWVVGFTLPLINSGNVLSTCPYKEGQLALLVTTPEKLCVKVVNIKDGELIDTYYITVAAIPSSKKNFCTLTWVPVEKMEDEFFKNWFREGREKCEVFLITLPTGTILALFPGCNEVEYIYVWPCHFVLSDWHTYTLPDCDNLKFCKLILISSNGSVLTMTDDGEMIKAHAPVEGAKSAYIDGSRYLYLTDWRLSWRYTLEGQSQNFIMLPLMGILCWTGWGPKYSLALSRAGDLYCVDNTFDMTNLREILPNSSQTAKILRKLEALEQMNSKIAKVETYMVAIGLMNQNPTFSISTKTAYVRKWEFTICLEIECLTEELVFSRDDWMLHISLRTGKDDTWGTCQRLRESLEAQSPVRQFITFKSSHRALSRLYVTVNLLYRHRPPKNNDYRPTIFVGKSFMDASYFIQPVSEIDLPLQAAEPEPSGVYKILKRKMKNRDKGPKVEETESCEIKPTEPQIISLQISLGPNYPPYTFFKNLLANCQPLWRTAEWNSALEMTKQDLMIANKVITVELEGDVVTISGDPDGCYMIKQAVFFSSKREAVFNVDGPQALAQLEEYQRSMEVLSYMDEPPTEQIEEILRKLRENITSKLTFA